ncbi:ABC transporter ATP-binding protein [Alicyclobacillus mengziensis]|uniref:ABC transporter ATP-binding protein n=1 Tax=Alicyclobacillus mengziensis TaxID=2931921 RepID=A0A9X7W1E8_9BACL|nr:ABC transporter ATP-binding protein [Alicyclobacillus mengziensis]QSO48971.1 ABC transporter ATP-binding protein [Alicyclobacillus mengziensis]
MENVLEVKNLEIQFEINEKYYSAVKDVDFFIRQGETLGLVGESGCGKSVTSLSIMRLLQDSAKVSGSVMYNGKDLLKLPESKMRSIRGNEISMIFQEPMTSLNPVHRIGRQIGESLMLHKGMSARRARQEAIELLRKVGIPRADEVVDDYPHQFSGGMRQRVMIAIAMACEPKLLIADEPTTALDVTIQAQILDLMRKLAKENNMAILLITHDLGVVAEMCDRVAVMYAGRVMEQGPVREIFRNPQNPYTIGLMNSIPKLEGPRTRLQPIEGNVPSVRNMPQGCRFTARCPYVMDICREHDPGLLAVAENHISRCWLHADIDADTDASKYTDRATEERHDVHSHAGEVQ